MKTIFLLVGFTVLWFNGNCQTDYIAHPQIISTENKLIKVNWINSSTKKCAIDLNHFVVFNNVESDRVTGSTVEVGLYKNRTLIKAYVFAAGDGIFNRIYTSELLQLKKGDSIYFIFKLLSVTAKEEYVFNIFQKKYESKLIPAAATTNEKKDSYPDQYLANVTDGNRNKERLKSEQRIRFTDEQRRQRFNKTMLSVVGVMGFLLGL